MRSFKHFGALVAVFALCALGAANAQAESLFTSSAGSGTISGTQTNNQVFKTTSGNVTCTKASATGTIGGAATTQQEAEVTYSECKANGVATAHVSKAVYLFTANRTVHLLNTVTITVTKTLFTAHCTITITPQTPAGLIDYEADSPGLIVTSTNTGIEYHVSGQPCGEPGTYTDGTYTGSVTVKASSGSLSWDA